MSQPRDTTDPGTGGAPVHQPVLTAEAVHYLAVEPGGVYLDATVGHGGHAAAVLDASASSGRVLGIDLDPRSLALAARRLQSYGSRYTSIQGNYADMARLAKSRGFPQVDGIVMDLGFSSAQIEDPGYGLSFRSDEPLDMRYDPAAATTAAHIVNSYPEKDLADLIFRYGEEPKARAIARSIVRYRLRRRAVESAAELAGLVAGAVGPRKWRRTHPATRTFQALRIAVNGELANLEAGLTSAVQLLPHGGRLVVISYHSLEDRVVKTFLARESSGCVCPPEAPECVCAGRPSLRLVQRKVIKPCPQEVQRNPRSRSAKMRVASRT